MRKTWIVALATLLLLAGCASTDGTEDVAFGIDVWKTNTISLSANYNVLLDRAVPPSGPEDESDDDKADRLAAWDDHVSHDRALMEANNALATKTHTWAQTCYDGGKNDEQSP